MKPNDYGRLAFACCAKAYLRAPRDRELIEASAERKQQDRVADVVDLVAFWRSAVRPLDMRMEDAMRLILTAGVSGSARPAKAPAAPDAR